MTEAEALDFSRESFHLLVLDPGLVAQGGRRACDEQCLRALFSVALKAVRKGGSVAVLVDMWSLTSTSSALNHAGFKQLRYVQAVSETGADVFYPDNSRTMAILAVKGGGSTFNDFYNNGHFPRPVEVASRMVVYEEAARGASGVAQRAAGVPLGGHRQSSVEVWVVRP